MSRSGATMSMVGDKALMRKLQRLPIVTEKRIIRQAVRAGSQIVQGAARENARSMIGGHQAKRSGRHIAGEIARTIARFIRIKTWDRPFQRFGSWGQVVWIDPKGNDQFVVKSKTGKRNYIPAAIEYGHGNAAPIPFFRTAFDRTKHPALSRILRMTLRGILQEARKK